MSGLTYKGYTARVEFDADDMLLVGRLSGINDIVSFHATDMKELVLVFRDAVEDYVATCAKIGKKPEKSYSGKLMLRVDPELHADVAAAAEQSGQSLNQYGMIALRRAVVSHSASRELAKRGGTEPDLAAPPR